MNKILKLNIFYYISFIIISISRLITSNNIISNIIFPIIIIIYSYLLSYIYYKKIKKEKYKFNIINTTLPVLNLTCYYLTNNYTISIFIIILISLLYKIIKINYISLYYIIYFIICHILHIDISITYNTIILLIMYCILLFNEYYKREIALFTINSYVITALVLYLFNIGDITHLTNNFLLSSILYIAILVVSNNEYSPLTFIGKVIYSFIIGITSCLIISFKLKELYIHIIIIILSTIIYIINKNNTRL